MFHKLTETIRGSDLVVVPPEERDPKRSLTPRENSLLRERDEDACWLDGLPCEGRHSPDHVAPWSKGGETSLENSRAAHLDCNYRRGYDTSFLDDVEFERSERGFYRPVDIDSIDVPEETKADYRRAHEQFVERTRTSVDEDEDRGGLWSRVFNRGQ